MKTTVAAIDFGTSKIVTLVAENSGTQRCDILGVGSVMYDGYLEEGWNNPGALSEAIQSSIQDAAESSKHKISRINVGVPGAFSRVYAVEVAIELKGADAQVKPSDVPAIFKRAMDELGKVPGVFLHSSPAWFMVDDGKKTLEPVGLKGRELRALISIVMGSQYFVDEINNRLQAMGIMVDGFYSTAAGEAMLFLPEEDRDRTAVLLDVGYLNTEVMVVEGDALIFHDTIDIGGGNIAADLAMGLDIPLRDAEQIKRAYKYGITAQDQTYTTTSSEGQKPMTFTREQVAEIIEPRVDEIAELVDEAIKDSGIRLGKWSNIYLTGGALAINNGKDYLSGKLEQLVRDVPKRTTKLNSQLYSSTLGLMDLIIDTIEEQQQAGKGVGGKIKEFFRSLLGG